MSLVLYLGEAFVVAYLMRLAATRLKIPYVSMYVVGGVLIGGSLFFWIPGSRVFSEHWLYSSMALDQLTVVTQIALGTIAFIIGAELEWRRIRTLGRSILFIAFFESLGAFLLVTATVLIFWRNLPLAFLLGAVSSATAPAATVAIIQQYRARGPLTHTILAVVGIDDAISFMIFAFALALAKGSFTGEGISLAEGLLRPVAEVIIALGLGSILGFIGVRLIAGAQDQETVTFLFAAIIFLVTGIALLIHVSELLAGMAAGAAVINADPIQRTKIRSVFGAFMPVFYALFFIIGGAHLDISVFPAIWLLALIYFFARSAGKVAGAYTGAVVGKALPQVRDWVGVGLLPQVGAAIALALALENVFGNGAFGPDGAAMARQIFNVLLVTTLLTEFVGPYLMKISLFKTGEAERERE
ncbi:MAG: cation:proton antiporter [Candidatus Latescibacterota bacterium]